MKILIAGASGLVGKHLVEFFRNKGYSVLTLNRSQALQDEIFWDPEKGRLDPAQVENFDAFINLSGENIAGRWNANKKEKILDSRLRATETIVKAIGMLKAPPRVLINASAVGYYGSQGDQILTEESPSGEGFLAQVCREWEAAALEASQKGVRVALVRFGTVLSPKGGALAQMLTPFKLGMGGVIGSGKQYISWIDINDLAEAIEFVLTHENIQGPVNLVSPNPVTNEEFTKILGGVLKRPTILPIPASAVRFMFGEMADELLLSSARVLPSKLLQAKFSFRFPSLEPALQKSIT